MTVVEPKKKPPAKQEEVLARDIYNNKLILRANERNIKRLKLREKMNKKMEMAEKLMLRLRE